ncbi:MAG TPA: hypothetical protein VGS07_27060 [Thermoanaerobaculia bacterium]|jgi:hypothetical protein|nr:hypothetical protein [Thermoanaerobaculia bacterium]
MALGVSAASAAPILQHVFVIAMENHDSTQIYGNTTDAPYINNTLIPAYAHSTNFNDTLALSIPSEPHYVWMERAPTPFPIPPSPPTTILRARTAPAARLTS